MLAGMGNVSGSGLAAAVSNAGVCVYVFVFVFLSFLRAGFRVRVRVRVRVKARVRVRVGVRVRFFSFFVLVFERTFVVVMRARFKHYRKNLCPFFLQKGVGASVGWGTCAQVEWVWTHMDGRICVLSLYYQRNLGTLTLTLTLTLSLTLTLTPTYTLAYCFLGR